MIRFLTRATDHRDGATLRAGGTDVTVRRRLGILGGDLDDLRDVPGLDRRVGPRLGAKLRLAALASDPELLAGWPLLAAAAAATATPQVRAVATLGGNLIQSPFCAWYRDPGAACRRRGGDACSAQDAGSDALGLVDHPCGAPHPSTLATALLAYAPTVESTAGTRDFSALLAEGLAPGEVLLHLVLPEPAVGERGHYARATRRAYADRPMVEVAARRVGAEWTVVAGAIGPSPQRLGAVEAALGAKALPGAAAARAAEGLPKGWKRDVLVGVVQEAIEHLW